MQVLLIIFLLWTYLKNGCNGFTGDPFDPNFQSNLNRYQPRGQYSAMVPGHYIVIIKDGTSDSAYIQHLVRLHKANQRVQLSWNIELQNNNFLIGYSIRTSASDVQDFILSESVVETVEYDHLLFLNQQCDSCCCDTCNNPPVDCVTQSNVNWGLSAIANQENSNTGKFKYHPQDGEDINVYLLDSRVKKDHETINGRVSELKLVLKREELNKTVDIDHFHGTHISGIIAGTIHGVAKKANITNAVLFPTSFPKAKDGEPPAPLALISQMILALGDIVFDHASKMSTKSVLNLSFGAWLGASGNMKKYLDKIFQEIGKKGIIPVAAAGNLASESCDYYPAASSFVIGVGATGYDGNKGWAFSGFSNYGQCVDILAPGFGITSIWDSGIQATRVMHGTSFAAAHVSGAIAAFMSRINLTPTLAQVQTWLTNNCIKGRVSNIPAGAKNCHLYIDCAIDDSV